MGFSVCFGVLLFLGFCWGFLFDFLLLMLVVGFGRGFFGLFCFWGWFFFCFCLGGILFLVGFLVVCLLGFFFDFKKCLMQIYVRGKSLNRRLCQRVGLLSCAIYELPGHG